MIDANKDKQHERDHEKAEKWDMFESGVKKLNNSDLVKYEHEVEEIQINKEIIERLKKRIEECSIYQHQSKTELDDNVFLVSELQKILGGKE